jgi:hypothetical protein
MKRFAVPIMIVGSLLALAGCSKKAEQTAQTASDSLLATNPIEQPQGNLNPQTDYQQPQEQAPPAATPKSTPKSRGTTSSGHTPAPAPDPGVTVPEGTAIEISVDAQLSSEFVHEGDAWTGVVKSPVVIGTAAPIPAGSAVHGVISAVQPAEKGERAFLVLSVSSVTVNGSSYEIQAGADSIIAGSAKARNIGAIAGGTAAGAIIGKAVGGGGKGALIGGLLGGAAATGAVVKSKGYQAIVKEGTVLTFKVERPVKIRA